MAMPQVGVQRGGGWFDSALPSAWTNDDDKVPLKMAKLKLAPMIPKR
jgi:hypothetical protein